MNQQSDAQDSLVLSYLSLRKAVGIIGVMLPFVLAFGNMILSRHPGIERSISSYYYTDLGNVFVGSLCAIGVFLLSTRGYDRRDRIAGYLACVFAVGVALFPTTPDNPTLEEKVVGVLHYTSAALLFLTLAFFCFKLFTQTDRKIPTRRKRQRNRVYRISGSIIVACILLIAVVKLPAVKTAVDHLKPVFWLESLAVVTFGVAWLTKGEMILKDEESPEAAKSATAGYSQR